MALLDFLFGSKPKVSTQTLFTADDIQSMFEQFLPLIQEQLTAQGQGVLSGAAAFGPGFQGAIPSAVAGAQNQSLLQLLNLATQGTAASKQLYEQPGSPGLIPSIASGLSGGIGIGLGASLLKKKPPLPQGLPGADFDATYY